MSEIKTVCGKCKDSPSMLCVFTYPASCPFAPLLKALPDASEEQIRIATAVIRGVYDCWNCSVTGDFGDGKLHPCRVYEDVPYGWPCERWTQRDKEA